MGPERFHLGQVARPSCDRGASVPEFVFISIVLAFVLVTLGSVILWAYAKVAFTSAVAEAARYAANYNADTAQVTTRARELMGTGILAGTRDTLTCRQSVRVDTGLVELDCTMDTPGLLPILNDVFPQMHVVGHSLKETTPQ